MLRNHVLYDWGTRILHPPDFLQDNLCICEIQLSLLLWGFEEIDSAITIVYPVFDKEL
jgi:hypothetical protein